MKHDKITPYHNSKQKQEQVSEMFNNIANSYDLLNSLLSFGIHKGWRKKCVQLLAKKNPKKILDVATGTGDFAIACMKLNPDSITGIDISEGMLNVGREKVEKLGLSGKIKLESGNAETYSATENSYDAIVVGFGVRNFQDLEKGLINLRRLLKPGGTLLVLEFSYPRAPLIRAGYNFYFSVVTPAIGRLFSRDKRAYSYLTESVKAFPHNEKFVAVLEKSGYESCSFQALTMGVAAIYQASK